MSEIKKTAATTTNSKASSALNTPGLKRTTTLKTPSTTMMKTAASTRNLKQPTTETKIIPTKRFGVASGLSKSYAQTKPTNASDKKITEP